MGSEDKTVILKNPKSESQYTALLSYRWLCHFFIWEDIIRFRYILESLFPQRVVRHHWWSSMVCIPSMMHLLRPFTIRGATSRIPVFQTTKRRYCALPHDTLFGSIKDLINTFPLLRIHALKFCKKKTVCKVI